MAALGNGRAAGWNKLTADQMNMIKEKFVPYAPRFGSTGYATQDAWMKHTFWDYKADPAMIEGTRWTIVTADGTPVPSEERTLEGALRAFTALPKKERQPEVEDRGPHDPKLYYADVEPAPGMTFVKVYCRPLEPAVDALFQPARKIDLTEFGGKPSGNSMPSRIHEPQREWLWLTDAEVRSLAPGDRKKGETYPIPAAIRQRIFLFYLYNWFSNSGGGYWGPRLLRSGDLSLTVEESSGPIVRLRLEGNARFEGKVGKGTEPHGGSMYALSPRETGQKDVPNPYDLSYDARLLGVVEYDTSKQKLTRFDAVALGDYRGHWGIALKAQPVTVAFAFQLDAREIPPEYRHAPFALSALRQHYWAADQWKGRP
jgi:hypothetical protein